MTSIARSAVIEPIAVVGIGCRFPGGVRDPDDFWRLLTEGRDAITEIPGDRIDLERYFDPRPATPGRMMTRWGGFLDRIDEFDARFFEIAPREAERLDPQQRLLLESSWEALEDAGFDVRGLEGSRTGVFVGQWLSDFEARLFADPETVDFYMTTGSGRYAASGRVSYALGLTGPSLTIDTACSSSLAAVHLAVRSLRSGECDVALAGGVNIILQPHISIAYSQSRMMAPDGRCKFGDARGDGYVRSEGAGVVVLKPLSRALEQNDRIYAAIRGSALNNDGRRSGSLGTPSSEGQIDMLRAAYRDAGVAPAQVGYVEAHGTGTRSGDPVELSSLGIVLGEGRPSGRPCMVGSVKTNLGHTEGAAGVAGLIKVALSLHRRAIPASLNLVEPNPVIPWDRLPLDIPRTCTPWPPSDGTRFAGVSAFGIAGTNAHVVLEECPAVGATAAPCLHRTRPLAISAASPEALRQRVRDLRALLLGTPAPDGSVLRDVCYTACLRRTHLEHRLVSLGSDVQGLVGGLDAFLADEASGAVVTGSVPVRPPGKVAFVFPGQGGQHVGMGRELYRSEPAFRDAFDAVDAAVRAEAGWSPVERMHAEEAGAGLEDIGIVQPMLFAVEVALASLWRSYGITPDAVVGHSMGEAAAAYVAGALSIADAVRVICRRSALLRRVRGLGAMAVVELDVDQAAWELAGLEDRLSVAASNSRRSSVLSGDPGALESVLARLEARSVFCRRVQVDVASHSPQMEPLLPELRTALADLAPLFPSLPMLSTVDLQPIEGKTLDANYWVRNLRERVRLSEVIARLLDDGFDTFVEIGPHPLLLPSIRQDADVRGTSVAAVESMRRGVNDSMSFHAALAALHVTGRSVDWRPAFPDAPRLRSLPAYPWQRSRYWYEPPELTELGAAGRGGLLGPRLSSSIDAGVQLWPVVLSERNLTWLRDHRVRESTVMPAAAFVSIVLDAVIDAGAEADVEITDLSIDEALVLRPSSLPEVQLAMLPGVGGPARFRISSREPGGDAWRVHVSGRVAYGLPQIPDAVSAATLNRSVRDASVHYAAMSTRGLEYGPAFRAVADVAIGVEGQDAEGVDASLELPRVVQRGGFAVHPVLLDGGLQVALELMARADPLADAATTLVPVEARSVRWRGRRSLGVAGRVHACLRVDAKAAGASSVADLRWVDVEGAECLTMTGLRFARVGRTRGESDALLHEVAWSLVTPPTGAGSQGRWLLLADRGGVADRVADVMRARGIVVDCAPCGDADRTAARLRATADGAASATTVVSFGPMDAPDPDGTAAAFRRASDATCNATVEIVRTLAAGSTDRVSSLVVVTRGAQAVRDGEVPAVAQSPAWGLMRTVRNEHPELRACVVDLSHDPDDTEIRTLADALLRARPDQFAVRGPDVLVPGLVRASERPEQPPATRCAPAAARAYRIVAATPGILDGLVARPIARPAPVAGEVEIAVEATGLNFMNVLSALGRCPGYPGGVGPLGIECAGTVVRFGPGVTGIDVGSRVVAYAHDSLASHVIADARLVRPIPDAMTFEAAAGWPVVFMTAVHALTHCARLQRGERVLIHAAAGGVGLAAVQLALAAGAEVFATAGSPDKRALLSSLGVRHVMDSRSLAFREETLALTGGEGVDVVLNSLAGDFVAAGLEVLRPHGRFLEIGKQDIYADARIGLLPFSRNLSYFAIDLDRMARESPERVGALLDEVLALRARGVLSDLPTNVVAVSRVVDAFREMAAGRHHGKIVLRHGDADLMLEDSGAIALERGACLITGGLGGLGLAVGASLAARGAKRIALLARSSPNAAQRAAIDRIRQAGAEVTVIGADVADSDALRLSLAAFESTAGPISVVVHAAGVLDDAMLSGQSPDRFARVLGPKAEGAWNLHAYFADRPDVHLVLFSSVVSLLGLPGQANYAAANAYLDALAHRRRAGGGRSTSINWGPWAEVGMAAGRTDRGARLADRGLPSLTVREGLAALERVLEDGLTEVAVMHFDHAAYVDAYPSAAASVLLPKPASSQDSAPADLGAAPSLRDALSALPPGRRRRDAIEQRVKEAVGRVLREAASKIDRDKPFRSLGLDSLMGLELRNRLEGETGLALPATIVWNYPTVAALAGHLGERLGIPLEPAAFANGHGADSTAAVVSAELADGDTTLEAMLAEIEQLSPEAASRQLSDED